MTENELAQTPEGGGGMMEVATSRAAQEVQAAMVVAKKFPRDEYAAIERIRKACRRPRLAEAGLYTYPRGGQRVEGISIRGAEAMAQAWGNMDFGIIELEQAEGESHVMAYAWDLETNTRVTKVFTVPHERHTKRGVFKLKDPRDVYELTANQGSRRLRACILGVIPGDVQDIAEEEIRATLSGASETPLEDRVRAMVQAFGEKHQVTPALLKDYLGHDLDATSDAELVTLRGIFQSMSDGMSDRDKWFSPAKSPAAAKAAVKRKKKEPGEPAKEDGPKDDGTLPGLDTQAEMPPPY